MLLIGIGILVALIFVMDHECNDEPEQKMIYIKKNVAMF